MTTALDAIDTISTREIIKTGPYMRLNELHVRKMPGQLPRNFKCLEECEYHTSTSKRVEARSITVEYSFLSLTCSAGIGFRQNGQHLCLERALLHSIVHYTGNRSESLGSVWGWHGRRCRHTRTNEMTGYSDAGAVTLARSGSLLVSLMWFLKWRLSSKA